MKPLRPFDRLLRAHRRVLVHRRPLAALAAAGAVLAAVQATSPPPPPTVAVLTAGRDLPGGSVLRPQDLELTRLPHDAAPDGALRDAAAVSGRTLAAPLARGEVVTEPRTVGVGLLAGYPGRTAVPVRVSDAAVVDLLRVGDRVTLVGADPEGRTPPATLAEDVPVIAIPREAGEAFGSATPGRLVLVAVSSACATEVAARSMSGYITVVWNR